MKRLATGWDADVFDLGDGRVLRRCRDGRTVTAEAAVMIRLRELADGATELDRAVAIRRRNPTMTDQELADLGKAAELVRAVRRPGRW